MSQRKRLQAHFTIFQRLVAFMTSFVGSSSTAVNDLIGCRLRQLFDVIEPTS